MSRVRILLILTTPVNRPQLPSSCPHALLTLTTVTDRHQAHLCINLSILPQGSCTALQLPACGHLRAQQCGTARISVETQQQQWVGARPVYKPPAAASIPGTTAALTVLKIFSPTAAFPAGASPNEAMTGAG